MSIEKTVHEFSTELANLTPKSDGSKYEGLLNSIHMHIRDNPSFDTDTFKDKGCTNTYEDIKANVEALNRLEQRRLTKRY